jgi:hypothetical protein
VCAGWRLHWPRYRERVEPDNGHQVFDRQIPCVSFVLEMSDSTCHFFKGNLEIRESNHKLPLAFRFCERKNFPRLSTKSCH